MVEKLPSTKLFDLNFDAVSLNEACNHLTQIALEKAYDAKIVVTPNVDNIVRLSRYPELRQQYDHADYIFADGMPVVWASKMTGHPLPERVTGADLFVALMHQSVKHHLTVFVVGGLPEKAQFLSDAFQRVYPGCHVHLYCPSMQFDFNGTEGIEAVERINAVQPDMVFVCLGAPKQENWTFTHQLQLKTSLIFCVGAAMDFALALKNRAPLWMQKAGLEWLWRLMSEPRRLWKRYFIQGKTFIPLCWKEWKKQRGRV